MANRPPTAVRRGGGAGPASLGFEPLCDTQLSEALLRRDASKKTGDERRVLCDAVALPSAVVERQREAAAARGFTQLLRRRQLHDLRDPLLLVCQ